MNTNAHATSQPLPDRLQESIWVFVRAKLREHEDRVKAKVAKFEIHLAGSGQIEVEVLATESATDAAIDEGLEEAGLKGDEVNRTVERERLAEELEETP
jgi:hypothetical protein